MLPTTNGANGLDALSAQSSDGFGTASADDPLNEPYAPPVLPPPTLEPEPQERLLDDKEYIAIFQQMFYDAKNARLWVERQWNVNHALYMNHYDFRNKAPWQHKGWISKVSEMVDGKRAALQSMMVKSNGQYFQMEPHGTRESEIDFADVMTKTLRIVLDEADFDDVIFPPQLTMAQLAAMTLKIGVARDKKGRLQHLIEPVSPWDYYLDPLGMGKYCIHISRYDLSAFKEVALGPESPYVKETVREINEDYRDLTRETEAQMRDDLVPQGRARKFVEIAEVWGFVDDPVTGERLHSNCVFSIANQKYLVRRPQKNPYPHGRWPFVHGSVRRIPFSVYNKPPVSDIAGLARSYSEFTNMMLDSALLFSMPAFQAYYPNFEHPTEILNGYMPGKLYFSRSSLQNQPLIQAVELGNMKADIFQFVLGFLDQHMGSHIMPGAELGSPTGQKVTASEAVLKSQGFQQFTSSEVSELETQIIEPMVEMMGSNEIWFRRFYRQDSRFGNALDDKDITSLEGLTERDRWELATNMRFKARGISALMNAQDKVEVADNILQRIMRSLKGLPPEIAMPILYKVNLPGIIGFMAQNTAIPKRVVLRTEEESMDYIRQSQRFLAEAQAVQMLAQVELQNMQQQMAQGMQQPQGQLPAGQQEGEQGVAPDGGEAPLPPPPQPDMAAASLDAQLPPQMQRVAAQGGGGPPLQLVQ